MMILLFVCLGFLLGVEQRGRFILSPSQTIDFLPYLNSSRYNMIILHIMTTIQKSRKCWHCTMMVLCSEARFSPSLSYPFILGAVTGRKRAL
jgi:hypothetical protein